MLATKRCQELKETLQVTKSFIEGKGLNSPYQMNRDIMKTKIVQEDQADEVEDEEYLDSDDALEEVVDYEDEEEHEAGVCFLLLLILYYLISIF